MASGEATRGVDVRSWFEGLTMSGGGSRLWVGRHAEMMGHSFGGERRRGLGDSLRQSSSRAIPEAK